MDLAMFEKVAKLFNINTDVKNASSGIKNRFIMILSNMYVLEVLLSEGYLDCRLKRRWFDHLLFKNIFMDKVCYICTQCLLICVPVSIFSNPIPFSIVIKASKCVRPP